MFDYGLIYDALVLFAQIHVLAEQTHPALELGIQVIVIALVAGLVIIELNEKVTYNIIWVCLSLAFLLGL